MVPNIDQVVEILEVATGHRVASSIWEGHCLKVTRIKLEPDPRSCAAMVSPKENGFRFGTINLYSESTGFSYKG